MSTNKKMSNTLTQARNTWSPSCLWDPRQTDITLVLESWEFNVHKDVLEKYSDYFAAMFSSQMLESVKDIIELHLVNPEHFKVVIEGIYTESLELSYDNVLGVAQVVQMLQIRSMQSKYIDFMRHNLINLEHCLELLYFCIQLNIQELYYDIRRLCLAHFSELRHSSSFVKLSLAELYDYLSDKYLVVEEEVDVVEAIHKWVQANKSCGQINNHEDVSFKAQVKKIVCSCVCVKDIDGACDIITDVVFSDECLPRERFQFALAKRPRQEDVFMFWSLLTTTTNPPDGLVDVVKLCLDTGIGTKFASMTDIVEKPGFQLGSALCALGPCVYLSGGGPRFGKTNWIRKIWKFDMSQPSQSWSIVGDLIDFRRSHAMVIIKNKLYIFGGFGKFRTKNSQLHSLDLRTGNWEGLPPMPAHELNPAATVCDDRIFYMCTDWRVYSFSISTEDWSSLSLWNAAPHRPPVESKPVAMFPLKTGDTDCFAVVTLRDSCLRVPLLHIENEAMKLFSREEDIASTTISFAYAGSVAVNGDLVLFLTSERVEDNIYGESETSHLEKTLIFDHNKNCFCDLPAVQNVRKAQSIIALPCLPATFKMGTLDFR